MPCHYSNPGSTFTSNRQLQPPEPTIPGPAYNSVAPISPLAVKGSQCISQSLSSVIFIIFSSVYYNGPSSTESTTKSAVDAFVVTDDSYHQALL